MSSPDPVEVHLIALIAIERNGERALEIAEETLSFASSPDFAMAVIEEIKRILAAQGETYH